jgi:hypothetical protein
MRKREPRDKRKWNEADFVLQIQDGSKAKQTEIEVIDGRIMTIPRRTRSLKIGKRTFKINLCLHGKSLKITCPTCEYEAPRIIKGLAGGTAFI